LCKDYTKRGVPHNQPYVKWGFLHYRDTTVLTRVCGPKKGSLSANVLWRGRARRGQGGRRPFVRKKTRPQENQTNVPIKRTGRNSRRKDTDGGKNVGKKKEKGASSRIFPGPKIPVF